MRYKAGSPPTSYELLDSIRVRPGMFMLTRSLSSLRHFLNGFFCGRNFAEPPLDGDPPFDDFGTWLHYHHKAPGAGGGGWHGAISQEVADDQAAFDRFFEYLDAYRQRVPALQLSLVLSMSQRRFYKKRNRVLVPRLLKLVRYKGERCIFLRAYPLSQRRWYTHTVFSSLVQARAWLGTVFAVPAEQWTQAKEDS